VAGAGATVGGAVLPRGCLARAMLRVPAVGLDPENPGEIVRDASLVHALKSECQRLSGGGSGNRFPGSQPVSLLREHMGALKGNKWLVCEKSDGVRYLLLIYKINFRVKQPPESWQRYLGGKTGTCFLVNRKYEFLSVPALDAQLGEQCLANIDMTLLDGELVYDTVLGFEEPHKRAEEGEEEDGGADKALSPDKESPSAPQEGGTAGEGAGKAPAPVRRQSTFLIFDALSVRNKYVGDLDLFDRLRVTQGEVIFTVRRYCMQTEQPEQACTLTLKQMYAKQDVGFVLDCVIPSTLPHGNDGLIFTRYDKAYVSGTCEGILKWKPRHLNSVDFSVAVRWARDDSGAMSFRFTDMFAAQRGSPLPWGFIFIDDEVQRVLIEKYQNRTIIIECVREDDWPNYEPPLAADGRWCDARKLPGPGWRFHRVREDKHVANDIRTVQSTIKSIDSGITEEVLKEALAGAP
jgi:mRNA guanylyltransferase